MTGEPVGGPRSLSPPAADQVASRVDGHCHNCHDDRPQRHGAAPGRDVAQDHRDLAVNTNPMNASASSAGSRNTKAITGHAGKRQDFVGLLAPRTADIRSLLARLSATVSDQ
jgi:hypothetical protein